ncbi:MAG TPA: agmatinase [Aggregatilineales bacterium]|nr:agmatinase [Anaerolineales bacterium]HRE49265.1 agmatinase [Aggregatilineales bacterium]
MSDLHYRTPERFLGVDDEAADRDRSAVWVLPIPLDMTTSYLGGTRHGAAAIIDASNQVELYDPVLGSEAALSYGVHTLPHFHPPLASAEGAVAAITAAVSDLHLYDRLLVTLGGEHSLTPGVIRALAPRFPGLVMVQLDAHCDLRESFDGTPYSHASATRRSLGYVERVYQFGIRSICQEEVDFLAETSRVHVWYADAMHADRERLYLKDIRAALSGRPIYLSIDLDGFDPSVFPAVGTPEPGGISWYDGLALIQAVVEAGDVVAFDCVELCPMPGAHGSAFAAAKLVYKTMSMIMHKRGRVSKVSPLQG